MVATFHADLTVSRDSMVPGIVDPLVREGGRRAGFPSQEVETLVAAVKQAATAIMQRAFEPNEPGTLRFTSDLTPASWTLAMYESGLPLDMSVEESTSGSASGGPAGTPVWAHVHEAVDEVHWVHHGTAGSELRLVKYRRQGHVAEQEPEEARTRAGEEVPQAPEQEYVIRRMRAEEAIHVAQCVYRAYGFSYPNDDLYYPERIVHLNETGELISAVAVDEAGDVPATFREPGLVDGPGRIAVSLDRVWGVGKIQVLQCGAASPIQIHQALRDLVDITGVEVVYLDLPLAQPGAPELCVAAENEGFFFGGVAPLFAHDGDALRMQYLNVDYDRSLLQVASSLGQDLVAYAAKERQRVMAARGGDMLMGPE